MAGWLCLTALHLDISWNLVIRIDSRGQQNYTWDISYIFSSARRSKRSKAIAPLSCLTYKLDWNISMNGIGESKNGYSIAIALNNWKRLLSKVMI